VSRAVTLLSAALAIVLVGCGGSGGDAASTAPSRPSTTSPRVIDLAPHRYAHPKKRVRAHRAVPEAKPTPPAPTSAVPRPTIVARPIPFPQKRRDEMAAYSQRHYGESTWRLTNPRVIVEHFTASSSFATAYNTFVNDTPDVELHELPGVCSHFIIDTDGTIYQLVPITIRCRHTVGLNYTAIGIEHVGTSDAQVMGNSRQLRASLRLTRWLRCSYDIKVRNVIGHAESLSSPYHHENVPALRTQTHGDMQRAAMERYRSMLAAEGC
jgi:beta-N-acetylhexosaminidase